MIDEKFVNIKFCEFDERVFELSQIWLSDPEIKELTLTPDTTLEERLKWFHSLKNRTDYFIKGVVMNDYPIGVVGLKNISLEKNVGEYFGYIGEKEYIGHGIGNEMIAYIIEMGKSMGLRLIILNVSNINSRAIKLYKKWGFVSVLQNGNIIEMHKELLPNT